MFRGTASNARCRFTPDTLAKLLFVMPAIAFTFREGHPNMVQIHSSRSLPLVARSPKKSMQNYKLGTAA